MSVDYCLPIIKSDKTEVLETIHGSDRDYRYFEVWLDYVTGVDEAFIKQLVELLGRRLVLLFRRQDLEVIQMDLEQRFHILRLLSGSETLVDLDVTTQVPELDYSAKQQLTIKTIVSYHNYEQTPDAVQLAQIIATMNGYQPSIYKLATLCRVPGDGLRLLDQLLELKATGAEVIVSGMGELGAITKVFGALWGNAMTFAPKTLSEQSATGQLTRSQLETIFKELGN